MESITNDQATVAQDRRLQLAARCQLDPIWYRALEEAAKLGCSLNMLDIAVLCSVEKPIFARPPRYEQVADLSRAAFAAFPSDHLALANAFNMYMRTRQKHQEGVEFDLNTWCLFAFPGHRRAGGGPQDTRRTHTLVSAHGEAAHDTCIGD